MLRWRPGRRRIRFVDIGNIGLRRSIQLVDLLLERKRRGHFCGFWRDRGRFG